MIQPEGTADPPEAVGVVWRPPSPRDGNRSAPGLKVADVGVRDVGHLGELLLSERGPAASLGDVGADDGESVNHVGIVLPTWRHVKGSGRDRV